MPGNTFKVNWKSEGIFFCLIRGNPETRTVLPATSPNHQFRPVRRMKKFSRPNYVIDLVDGGGAGHHVNRFELICCLATTGAYSYC